MKAIERIGISRGLPGVLVVTRNARPRTRQEFEALLEDYYTSLPSHVGIPLTHTRFARTGTLSVERRPDGETVTVAARKEVSPGVWEEVRLHYVRGGDVLEKFVEYECVDPSSHEKWKRKNETVLLSRVPPKLFPPETGETLLDSTDVSRALHVNCSSAIQDLNTHFLLPVDHLGYPLSGAPLVHLAERGGKNYLFIQRLGRHDRVYYAFHPTRLIDPERGTDLGDLAEALYDSSRRPPRPGETWITLEEIHEKFVGQPGKVRDKIIQVFRLPVADSGIVHLGAPMEWPVEIDGKIFQFFKTQGVFGRFAYAFLDTKSAIPETGTDLGDVARSRASA